MNCPLNSQLQQLHEELLRDCWEATDGDLSLLDRSKVKRSWAKATSKLMQTERQRAYESGEASSVMTNSSAAQQAYKQALTAIDGWLAWLTKI